MKSLILKDLYNIGHNVRSLVISMIFCAGILFFTTGGEGFVYMSTIIFTMMILTTFAFDENCKWNHYAMTMPVSKKDIVVSKYAVMIIFTATGAVVGLLVGAVFAAASKSAEMNTENMLEMLTNAAAAFLIGIIFGSMEIPLVFRFGTEKSRLLMFVSFLVPAALFFGIYKLLVTAGVEFTDALFLRILCFSPLFAAVWVYVTFRISCAVFERREI